MGCVHTNCLCTSLEGQHLLAVHPSPGVLQLAGRTRNRALGRELGCHGRRLEPQSAFKVFDFANVDASSTEFG